MRTSPTGYARSPSTDPPQRYNTRRTASLDPSDENGLEIPLLAPGPEDESSDDEAHPASPVARFFARITGRPTPTFFLLSNFKLEHIFSIF